MNQAASQLYLLTAPEHLRAAAAHGLPLAHQAYRLGSGAHLLRANFPAVPRGGLMMIGAAAFDGQGDSMQFCREVLRECNNRQFSGVIFDLDTQPSPALARLLAQLGEQLQRRNLPFYLPEAYQNYQSTAHLMVSTAISGGALEKRLEDAVSRYGAERIALCIDRSAEDFYLPAPQGSGRPLSREELHQRMESLSPSVFFSNELCAHYFTYMSQNSGAHFVLFDDVGSIRKKIALAEQLGIRQCFLLYRELDDLLPELLSSQP